MRKLKYTLVRPNVFQVDRNSAYFEKPVQLRTALEIRCPHCGVLGMFNPALEQGVLYPKDIVSDRPTMTQYCAGVYTCPNAKCAGLVFAIGDGNSVVASCPPETIQFRSDDIPPDLAATLNE